MMNPMVESQKKHRFFFLDSPPVLIYPPGNDHISLTKALFEDDLFVPQVEHVSSGYTSKN